MELTNDEFAAVIQSRDENVQPNLTDRINFDGQQRYNNFLRQNGFNSMSQQDFNSLRKYHMTQLFTAYKEEYDGTASNHQKWLGSPTRTDVSAIRRVLGSRTGGAEYEGPMVLDTETITAICHLASMRGYGHRYLDSTSWVGKMSYDTLTQVVDEMISTKNILLDNAKLEGDKYSLLTGSTIYRETGIAERAIENSTGMYYFDKIQHTETAHDFSKRKSNIFSKAATKFKNFFEKINDPDAYAKKMEQIGNKEFELNTNEGR